MAEPAQKEPTMEEILSSIRKIIADDDAPEPATAGADVITEDELDVFEDFEAVVEAEDEAIIESEEDVLAAISQSMEAVNEELEAEAPAEAVVEDEPFDLAIEEDNFESFAEEAFEGVEDFAEVEDSFEPVLEDAPEPEAVFAPEPEPEFHEEPSMSAKPAPLTDTATVTAAAGALGKLLSNVEFGEDAGGTTTIEGLVREMMRPMLKEWLDENLPGIVEKHVEAEVQRIARMAG